MRPERILIVGGGIGGLSLAAALRRHGFMPELIERSRSWRAVGPGIEVQPNAMRILRELGIGEAVEGAGTVICHWDFCDDQGEVLCETNLEALWAGVGPFIGIARGRLQRALLDGAAGVALRAGTSITALAQQADGVRVELSDGSVGSYDLVVGADGIGSTVRTLAIDATPPAYGGQMVWRLSLIQSPSPRDRG
jgi:FAD-dependent urate hydroxylase